MFSNLSDQKMIPVLVFATNNAHKLIEVRNAVGNRFSILSLADIGCFVDIPETADTLEGNASIKSKHIYDRYGVDCFADDTGLEVEHLGGKPGVWSARYAGDEHNHEKNIEKLLREMAGATNRKAQFRTVISLIINGTEFLFEGVASGTILNEKHGDRGFGYDPVFQPDGFSSSFAEMDLEAKNKISHRGLAVGKLAAFLETLNR
jgi:XTP/dITP diphosphohydrolase